MGSEAEQNLTVVEICSACMRNLTGVDSTFMQSSRDIGKISVFADGKPDPFAVLKLTRDKRNEAGDLVMDQIGVTRRCEYKTDTNAPSFRFHADLGVEASDDQVLVVEVWDYDTSPQTIFWASRSCVSAISRSRRSSSSCLAARWRRVMSHTRRHSRRTG